MLPVKPVKNNSGTVADSIWSTGYPQISHMIIYNSYMYVVNNTNKIVYRVTMPVTAPVMTPALNVVCFKEDSLILTDQGYVPVQHLRKGHLVRTLKHGYIPVYMIVKKEIYHPASEHRIKDQLYECSAENYPDVFEPLIITGCHSILVKKIVDDAQKQKNRFCT